MNDLILIKINGVIYIAPVDEVEIKRINPKYEQYEVQRNFEEGFDLDLKSAYIDSKY